MEITKQKLEEIYINNSNVKAAQLLNISTTTLVKYVKMAGIPLKGQGQGKVKEYKLKIIG